MGVLAVATEVQMTCGCSWGLIAQSVSMGKGQSCIRDVGVSPAAQAEACGTLGRSTCGGSASAWKGV